MKQSYTSLISRILVLSALFCFNSNALFAQKKKGGKETKMIGVAFSAVYSDLTTYQYTDITISGGNFEFKGKTKVNFPIYEVSYSFLKNNTLNFFNLYNLKYGNFEPLITFSTDFGSGTSLRTPSKSNNFESGIAYGIGKRIIKFQKSSISGFYFIGSLLGQVHLSKREVLNGNSTKNNWRILKIGLSFEPRYMKEWRNDLVLFVGLPIKIIDFTNWYYKSEGALRVSSSGTISEISTPLFKNVGLTIGLAFKL